MTHPSDTNRLDAIQLTIAAELSNRNTAPDTIEPITPETLASPPPITELRNRDTPD